MSRHKADKTKAIGEYRLEDVKIESKSVGRARYPKNEANEDYKLGPSREDVVRIETEAALADVHAGRTHPVMVEGLTDDPAGRVGETVYAQVFAATWVKRQDIGTERRLAAARAEAGTAMHLARTAYLADVGADKASEGQA